jgi:hypothetical protein
MNHPYINIPIYQEVLKLNLLIYEMELNSDYDSVPLYYIRHIIDKLLSIKLTNQIDNFINFYKFSPNCKISILKYLNVRISEIDSLLNFTEALDAQITIE